MILETTPTIHTEIELKSLLEQLSVVYSLSRIFRDWPLNDEKDAFIKGIKENEI